MQYGLLLATTIALAGCQSPLTAVPILVESETTARARAPHHAVTPPSNAPLPIDQLKRVKLATERYQDIGNAIADDYLDKDIVIPNMGRHFLNEALLLDGRFDLERPEILVYNVGRNGRMELVAVEYAIPRELSERAPEGFTGEADVWFDDPGFELWTLHAWVWKANPDGVFNSTNRLVP